MKPSLAVVALWAEDVRTTAHFYRDVIGLPLAGHSADRPHFQAGEALLVILPGKAAPAEGEDRFPRLAFGVEDLETAVERLKRHAVALPWGVEGDAHSRWTMFYDPAGNLVELVQFGIGQAGEHSAA